MGWDPGEAEAPEPDRREQPGHPQDNRFSSRFAKQCVKCQYLDKLVLNFEQVLEEKKSLEYI